MCYVAEVSGRNRITVEELNRGDNPYDLILDSNDVNLDNIEKALPAFMLSYYQEFADLPIKLFTRRPTALKRIPPTRIIPAS